MKKLLNSVDSMLLEALRGLGAAHADILEIHEEPAFVRRKGATRPGKVALISGGGSGHEPLHGGFVGRGMLDAACPGQVFTSPTPDQMAAAAQAVDGGGGTRSKIEKDSTETMRPHIRKKRFVIDPGSMIIQRPDIKKLIPKK